MGAAWHSSWVALNASSVRPHPPRAADCIRLGWPRAPQVTLLCRRLRTVAWRVLSWERGGPSVPVYGEGVGLEAGGPARRLPPAMPCSGSCGHLPKAPLGAVEASAGSRRERKRRGPHHQGNSHALQEGRPRLRAGSCMNEPTSPDSPSSKQVLPLIASQIFGEGGG